MIHIQVSIGDRIKATVTGEDPKVVIENVAFLSELPAECPICQAPTAFQYRSPKEFHYYGMVCTGSPAHECTFGQKREGNGLFYKGKDSWDKAYTGDGQGGGGGDQGQTESAPPATEDDIPF